MDDRMHAGGTVIPDDPLATLSDERLHRFFAYLEAKRGTRAFAARRDIDPLEFGYILGNVVLVEVQHAPLRFRYRLVGSNLAAAAGHHLPRSLGGGHPHVDYHADL